MPFGIRPSNVRVCHSTTRALCGSVKTFRRRQPLASALSVLPYKLPLSVDTRESDSVTLEPYASAFASLAMMCAWARHILKRSPRYSWLAADGIVDQEIFCSFTLHPAIVNQIGAVHD